MPVAYAYNRELSSRKLQDFNGIAIDTAMTFDARDGLPDYRHNVASSGLIVSFVDGHAAYVKREEISGNSASGAPMLIPREEKNQAPQPATTPGKMRKPPRR